MNCNSLEKDEDTALKVAHSPVTQVTTLLPLCANPRENQNNTHSKCTHVTSVRTLESATPEKQKLDEAQRHRKK